eukprot:GHVL01027832.1.p1 GENE.GHVL01027832.1~~GHVL01027832.1.p1  ORF type:complete len:194 (+),score=21.84 GHVL01027832.1:482-1063(+)
MLLWLNPFFLPFLYNLLFFYLFFLYIYIIYCFFFILFFCSALPVCVINGYLFYIIFYSLFKLIEVLKQSAKLRLFKRLYFLLVIYLLLSVVGTIYQIYFLSLDLSETWQNQWIVMTASHNCLFVAGLICVMWLWAPHKHSQIYAYCPQIDTEDVTPRVVGNKEETMGGVQVWAMDLDDYSPGFDEYEDEDLEN